MRTFFAIVEVILSVGMILCILFQTTKSEGLSGVIGGASSSSLGGKSSTDRQLESVTKYIAVGWLVATAMTTWFYFRG